MIHYAVRICVLTALIATRSVHATAAIEGRVVDAVTGAPIASATVTIDSVPTTADAKGYFSSTGQASQVMARAQGYRAATVAASDLVSRSATIRLNPFAPRALYLSAYGIANKSIRDQALMLVREGHLNALVIDVKGDRGMIAFRTKSQLAHTVGADRITTIPDLSALVRQLHDDKIYAIARVVVFKDDPLATARPDLAIETAASTLFRDPEGLAWTDPFSPQVRDYNLDIAVEAARAGFDEIQFDYLRFPETKGLRFTEANTMSSRVGAIIGFLAEARQRLAPYNVFIAVDVFGYVCWNLNDTEIGQRLEDIVPLVDYVSPMLYPSGFQFGIPVYPNPVQHPYEVVRASLDRAVTRTHVSPLHFRPWLQAFKDYAFDRRVFGAAEVSAQVSAAEAAGSDGWMLWNPRNIYAGIGF
jgi:hypothetical protein